MKLGMEQKSGTGVIVTKNEGLRYNSEVPNALFQSNCFGDLGICTDIKLNA